MVEVECVGCGEEDGRCDDGGEKSEGVLGDDGKRQFVHCIGLVYEYSVLTSK